MLWGSRGRNNKGALLGAASNTAGAIAVDFRRQRGIYALYADYDLVYVGQTGASDDRLLKRLNAHQSDHLSERWNRFSWFGTQWVTGNRELSMDKASLNQSVEGALNTFEAVAIAISEPRLNLQRGRWGDATKYFQWEAEASAEADEMDEE